MSTRQEDLQEVQEVLQRSRLYRLLSLGFRHPTPEGREPFLQLCEDLLDPSRGPKPEWSGAIPEGVRRLREAMEASTWAELDEEHSVIFGHTVQGDAAPYEGQYGRADIFQQTSEFADLSGFYRAFGLEVSPEVHERGDHISVELEFLHFLTYKEAYALAEHGRKEAAICRDARQRFLADHLLRWAPGFTRRLEQVGGTGFYGHLAGLARGVLEEEAALLEIEFGDGDLPLQAPAVPDEVSCAGREGSPGPLRGGQP